MGTFSSVYGLGRAMPSSRRDDDEGISVRGHFGAVEGIDRDP